MAQNEPFPSVPIIVGWNFVSLPKTIECFYSFTSQKLNIWHQLLKLLLDVLAFNAMRPSHVSLEVELMSVSLATKRAFHQHFGLDMLALDVNNGCWHIGTLDVTKFAKNAAVLIGQNHAGMILGG